MARPTVTCPTAEHFHYPLAGTRFLSAGGRRLSWPSGWLHTRTVYPLTVAHLCVIRNHLGATSPSGQRNLTQDRIAPADGRFNRIRQVAPTSHAMWAHWRHLADTIELVLPSAHPSPQPKRLMDRFSRFCTASSRQKVPVLYNRRRTPQNCPFSWGIWTPL